MKRMNRLKGYFLPAILLLSESAASAQDTHSRTSLSNPFVIVMLGLILLLLFVICSLSAMLLRAARGHRTKERSDILPAVATASGSMAHGLSDTAYYVIVSIIALEFVVIYYLITNLRTMLRQSAAGEVPQPAGIRDPHNRLPRWWLYGLYTTIVFAGIFLWRYHVIQMVPPPAESQSVTVADAENRKEVGLKSASGNMDEKNVQLLTSPADLSAGKQIFQTTCFACHGRNGEGGVGPNLTDDYWLHGGSIHEVFRTIKYGWPEKGMKSWKDDFSSTQIAQIASFVKSLHGTNPPNAKSPQGELIK